MSKQKWLARNTGETPPYSFLPHSTLYSWSVCSTHRTACQSRSKACGLQEAMRHRLGKWEKWGGDTLSCLSHSAQLRGFGGKAEFGLRVRGRKANEEERGTAKSLPRRHVWAKGTAKKRQRPHHQQFWMPWSRGKFSKECYFCVNIMHCLVTLTVPVTALQLKRQHHPPHMKLLQVNCSI